ncbi:MAG TPA: SPOR domain-containing protein [Candidatus Hydrogenedentes bacterium]|nr:SPOR domain-containing protein [Candidatus Hydrogenedentota bacterium]
MSRTQRLENQKEQNLLTAEFTPGQLIVLLCVFLFVAMACFGLGILVAQFDPSLEKVADDDAEAAADSSAEMETYTTRAFDREAKDGQHTATVSPAKRSPETPPPRNPYMDNTPRLTALPPLTPNRALPVQAEAPTRIPKADSPEPAADPAAPAAAESQPAEMPALTPIDPDEPLIETTRVVAQESAPQQQAQTKHEERQTGSVSSGGKFVVQLAAFSGSDRRAKAESFAKKIRSESNVNADIIPSDDDAHYRVVVGGFATRDSAAKACEELRGKPGLSEAFVRPL